MQPVGMAWFLKKTEPFATPFVRFKKSRGPAWASLSSQDGTNWQQEDFNETSTSSSCTPETEPNNFVSRKLGEAAQVVNKAQEIVVGCLSSYEQTEFRL